MKKLLSKYVGLFLLSCSIAIAVQAQTKPSDRNMSAEIAKLKAMQASRRDLVAKMNQGSPGNGTQPSLPPTANQGNGSQNQPGGLKASQQSMRTPPARKIKKHQGN